MVKHPFSMIFLLSFFPLSAQKARIISGKVEADASEDSQIHIFNITQKTGTYTSEDGKFLIKVNVNDSLLFSSIIYVPKKIVISSEVIKEGFLLVNLEQIVNQLEVVNISDT